MNVLFIASECAPFVKTGGLADVIGALPTALARLGVSVRVLLPGYPALNNEIKRGQVVLKLHDLYGGTAKILRVKRTQADLLILDAPHLFARPGSIYMDGSGIDWADNYLRFGALSRAGAELALQGMKDWQPDIINCHDWQAGLVPAFIKQISNVTSIQAPPVVMTIHNIAFQGLFNAKTLDELGLSHSLYHMDGIEFYSQVGFLKAGLAFSSKISTVSPTYARELLTPEFGMGLEGLLQSREHDLVGILNGIDINVWNPATDSHLAATYHHANLTGKAKNRATLEKRFKLQPNAHAPLFCVVSRLTEQKGLDLLLECLPTLVSRGARLVILGTGDLQLEQAFVTASSRYKGSIGVVIGYDEHLSHLMQGGSDAILIPSRFEPCGLTQLYGLHYGTLPVVARTGGLADTVIDASSTSDSERCATGFVFSPNDAQALDDAIHRCCEQYQDKATWQAMVRTAMQQPVDWDQSAHIYRDLYQSLLTTA